MATMKAMRFTCPSCGWSITTPRGMEDLYKHVMMHKEDAHPDMKMTEEKLKSMIKTVDVEGSLPKGKSMQKEESKAWRAQENIGKRFRSD